MRTITGGNVLSDPTELNLIPKVMDLKAKTVYLIHDVRKKIHELEVMEARAVKYKMKNEAELIHDQVMKLQDIQNDFKSVFFVRLDNLYNEIETKEKLDIIAVNFQDQLISTLDYIPDYVEDKRNLYEGYYRDLEAIIEMLDKSKS
jgi:hypothetical protein